MCMFVANMCMFVANMFVFVANMFMFVANMCMFVSIPPHYSVPERDWEKAVQVLGKDYTIALDGMWFVP